MQQTSIGDRYKRAVVTGGAGFVGSHLVEGLLADGLEVVSIDDYSGGKEANLVGLRGNPSLTVVHADVADIESIRPWFAGADIVFHQAVSKNTVCMRDPARDLEVNARGTLNVLTCARDGLVRKFVHASTGSVYGDARYFPTDEEHPVNPNSFYGTSKLAAEKYARVFHHLYGIDTTILRYYHVFGPRQEYSDVGGVVSIFGRRALNNEDLIIYGDGTQLRSFTYVKDIVAINKLVALKDGTTAESYNCASGIKITIKELADAVLAYYGKTHLGISYEDWKPGDVKIFDVDNSKLRRLGFEFRYSFDQGLGLTLDWLREYLNKGRG